MEKTKIQPIDKTTAVNYGAENVANFWKTKNGNQCCFNGHKDNILNMINNIRDGVICVYSEKISDKEIIQTLFNAAQRGVRIYILVNENTADTTLLQGKCLIRFGGVKNVGTFVLTNPNSNAMDGLFLGGQLSEASLSIEHIERKVTKDEGKELFRHFCYQFWQNAENEIIDNSTPSQVNSKPIEIYYDINKYQDKDYVWGTLFDFVESDCRSNLADQKIVYSGQEKQLPIEIKSSSEKNLGDNSMKELLPKNEFESQTPNFKDDGVSVNIIYTWRNVPYYLPNNATDHSLYADWQNEQKKINEKITALANSVEELSKKENYISSKIKRFFLGKKQKFIELNNAIEEIKKIDFSNIDEVEWAKWIKRINQLSDEISAHGIEIDNENQKAKLEEEIEKLQSKIKEEEKSLESKESEIRKISFDKGSINTKEIFIQKTKDEKEKIVNAIKDLNSKIDIKKKEIEKIGSQNNSEGSSLDVFYNNKKNQPKQNANKAFEIRHLPRLPKIGKLYQAGGQSYLAIEFWEDYDLGKNESQRLNAKLCVTK